MDDGIGIRRTRRELLEIGSLGLLGLSLPELLRAEERRAARRTGLRRDPDAPAKSCLLFFLEGGPAHQDLWDLKPDAPVEYRGPFRSISTSAPEIRVCEHLPRLAKVMRHFAIVRSVRHSVIDHNAGAYYALTGHSPVLGSRLILGPEPNNFPAYGSALARFVPSGRPIPDFVHIPEILSNNQKDLPGQFAGFLGSAYDPFVSGDPSLDGFRASAFDLREEVSPERFLRRRRLRESLLDSFAGEAELPDSIRQLESHYRRSFELLSSDAARRAFDLSLEDDALRERYGFDRGANRSKLAREFGGLPHLGQSLLLARRLLESGVRLVTVTAGRRYCQAWDTHRDHFPLLERSLLPMTDRAFSAFIEDMADRGLLDETLVVAMGEFGRTPRIGQVTSPAGADKGGRDHWPHCYSVLFAGGGIRGGTLFGASDKYAAYPERDPVGPEDIAATIWYALGIDPSQEIHDRLDRPHVLAAGRPLTELFG